MPLSPDGTSTDAKLSRHAALSICAMIAIGYCLTLLVFYPGVMTYDAKFVYEDIAKGTRGDWQSPVMTVLWALIDPIAPRVGQHVSADRGIRIGSALACSLSRSARRSVWLAVVAAVAGTVAPGLCLCRHHLARRSARDCWLLVGRAHFRGHRSQREASRANAMALALGLVALGVLFVRTR